MIDGKTIAVVIPAFRVEREIEEVLGKVPPEVDTIIVVDDASPDGLVERVSAHPDRRIRLVRHSRNQGVGAATVSGILTALETKHDIIVKCDGDGQMDPRDVPDLVDPIVADVADYAKGSRFHHSRELGTMPRLRFIGNIGLTFLTKVASGYWHILDPVNGFFALRATTAVRLPLGNLSKRFFFESDLLIHLNIHEARVIDVPLPARYGTETTNLSIASACLNFPPRLIWGLFRRLFWRYLFYDVSPVAIFALLGLFLVAFGLIFGTYEWITHAIRGVETPAGTVMTAVLPLIFGFQLLLQAVVLDIQASPRPGRRLEDNVRSTLRGDPVATRRSGDRPD